MRRILSILTLSLVPSLHLGPLAAEEAGPAVGGQDLPTRAELQVIARDAFQEAYEERKAELERQGKLVTAEITAEETEAMPEKEASRVSDAAVTPPTPNNASTTRDLLSFLVGALDLGKLSGGDGKDLVLAMNPEFFALGGGRGSGKVTFKEPEIFEPLALELPEDVREARKLALLDGLNEFDDVEVEVTWSKEGNRFGRHPADYRLLSTSLAKKISDALSTGFDEQAIQAVLVSVEERRPEAVVTERAREAGRAAARGLAHLQDLYQESGLFGFGDLIANQPQLHVDAIGRFRDPLVGRDEYGVEATLEVGFGNVNGLLRDCAPSETLSTEERFDLVSASCYGRFLDDHAQDWSKRFVVKVEYSKIEAYHHDLPGDDVSLDLDSAHTFRVTGGFGFDLAPLPETGNSLPRLDFEAKYENVSDEDVRNDDRLSATLTYTQKMSDSSSASLSVVYANDPEFLGEVDEELSAHVGLKFKVDSKKVKGGS